MALKLKLDSDLTPDIFLIGISTNLKDYRLSLFINNVLTLKLKKYKDFLFSYDFKDNKDLYSFYYYNDDENHTGYLLIGNRSDENILIPALSSADFFFMVRNNIARTDTNNLISGLRKIKNVQMAFPVDTKKIKNLGTLLNAIELFLIPDKTSKSDNRTELV